MHDLEEWSVLPLILCYVPKTEKKGAASVWIGGETRSVDLIVSASPCNVVAVIFLSLSHRVVEVMEVLAFYPELSLVSH